MLMQGIQDDEEQQRMLFETLFQKIFLQINSIKVEKFRMAEGYAELIKSLFDYPAAQTAFANCATFWTPNLNGRTLQLGTYLGKFLSFTCLFYETQSFKQMYFKGLSKQNPSAQQRTMDQVAEQFYRFHSVLAKIVAKLLENERTKGRMMSWLRDAVSANFEKSKMQSHHPTSSDGFIYSLVDVLLIISTSFTSRFQGYPEQFSKLSCYYLVENKYISCATKLEKLNQDQVNNLLAQAAKVQNQTGVTCLLQS